MRNACEKKIIARLGSHQAQHTLVTRKIASHTGTNIENLINNTGDGDLQPYYINAEVFDMILNCPQPYNSTRVLLSAPI